MHPRPQQPHPHSNPAHRRHGPRTVGVAVKLPRWQRLGLYASMAALVGSGVLWLAVHFFSGLFQDELAQSATKLWLIRIHAAAALAALVLVGSLLPVHIPLAWRVGRNRGSGASVAAVMAALTLTGYALWYASDGWARQGSSWLHWGLGAGVPLLLVLHVKLGRASAQ